MVKIISGGQTGVDRAALDAAIAAGIGYGGSVPKGRKAEDGSIDRKYAGLTELSSDRYRVRTERNVVDAGATLILTVGEPTEGTAYTAECAKKHGRPLLIVDMAEEGNPEIVGRIAKWLRAVAPSVLNVAGPRESKWPGIYERAYAILAEVLR